MFRGVTVPPDPVTIVTDYCDGGSLLTILRKESNIPWEKKLLYTHDIAKGELLVLCDFVFVLTDCSRNGMTTIQLLLYSGHTK